MVEKTRAPEWCYRRVFELTGRKDCEFSWWYDMSIRSKDSAFHGIADYIQQKEEPPADPDVVLARELFSCFYGYYDGGSVRESILQGDYDHFTVFNSILKFIKENSIGRR